MENQFDIINEKLKDHDERISENTEDINKLKINDAKQDIRINSFEKAVDKLAKALEKNSDKLDSFTERMANQKSDNWKWVIVTILIPAILFLLNKLVK